MKDKKTMEEQFMYLNDFDPFGFDVNPVENSQDFFMDMRAENDWFNRLISHVYANPEQLAVVNEIFCSSNATKNAIYVTVGKRVGLILSLGADTSHVRILVDDDGTDENLAVGSRFEINNNELIFNGVQSISPDEEYAQVPFNAMGMKPVETVTQEFVRYTSSINFTRSVNEPDPTGFHLVRSNMFEPEQIIFAEMVRKSVQGQNEVYVPILQNAFTLFVKDENTKKWIPFYALAPELKEKYYTGNDPEGRKFSPMRALYFRTYMQKGTTLQGVARQLGEGKYLSRKMMNSEEHKNKFPEFGLMDIIEYHKSYLLDHNSNSTQKFMDAVSSFDTATFNVSKINSNPNAVPWILFKYPPIGKQKSKTEYFFMGKLTVPTVNSVSASSEYSEATSEARASEETSDDESMRSIARTPEQIADDYNIPFVSMATVKPGLMIQPRQSGARSYFKRHGIDSQKSIVKSGYAAVFTGLSRAEMASALEKIDVTKKSKWTDVEENLKNVLGALDSGASFAVLIQTKTGTIHVVRRYALITRAVSVGGSRKTGKTVVGQSLSDDTQLIVGIDLASRNSVYGVFGIGLTPYFNTFESKADSVKATDMISLQNAIEFEIVGENKPRRTEFEATPFDEYDLPEPSLDESVAEPASDDDDVNETYVDPNAVDDEQSGGFENVPEAENLFSGDIDLSHLLNEVDDVSVEQKEAEDATKQREKEEAEAKAAAEEAEIERLDLLEVQRKKKEAEEKAEKEEKEAEEAERKRQEAEEERKNTEAAVEEAKKKEREAQEEKEREEAEKLRKQAEADAEEAKKKEKEAQEEKEREEAEKLRKQAEADAEEAKKKEKEAQEEKEKEENEKKEKKEAVEAKKKEDNKLEDVEKEKEEYEKKGIDMDSYINDIIRYTRDVVDKLEVWSFPNDDSSMEAMKRLHKSLIDGLHELAEESRKSVDVPKEEWDKKKNQLLEKFDTTIATGEKFFSDDVNLGEEDERDFNKFVQDRLQHAERKVEDVDPNFKTSLELEYEAFISTFNSKPFDDQLNLQIDQLTKLRNDIIHFYPPSCIPRYIETLILLLKEYKIMYPYIRNGSHVAGKINDFLNARFIVPEHENNYDGLAYKYAWKQVLDMKIPIVKVEKENEKMTILLERMIDLVIPTTDGLRREYERRNGKPLVFGRTVEKDDKDDIGFVDGELVDDKKKKPVVNKEEKPVVIKEAPPTGQITAKTTGASTRFLWLKNVEGIFWKKTFNGYYKPGVFTTKFLYKNAPRVRGNKTPPTIFYDKQEIKLARVVDNVNVMYISADGKVKIVLAKGKVTFTDVTVTVMVNAPMPPKKAVVKVVKASSLNEDPKDRKQIVPTKEDMEKQDDILSETLSLLGLLENSEDQPLVVESEPYDFVVESEDKKEKGSVDDKSDFSV